MIEFQDNLNRHESKYKMETDLLVMRFLIVDKYTRDSVSCCLVTETTSISLASCF